MKPNYTPKYRRCFHRVVSGLERGGQIRFISLTTDPRFPGDIHRHFRALVKRLQRRGLLSAYFQVQEFTKSGLPHKHVLFRGSYIDQLFLESLWAEIHGAPIVDIRKLRKLKGKRQIAGHIAKYFAKDPFARYSWSWPWVWRGFVKDWAFLKTVRNELLDRKVKLSYPYFIYYWRKCLRWAWVPDKFFELPLVTCTDQQLLAMVGVQKKGDTYALSP